MTRSFLDLACQNICQEHYHAITFLQNYGGIGDFVKLLGSSVIYFLKDVILKSFLHYVN